jgi:hypothetical protein
VGFGDQAPLLQLAQLPALQHLCLEYDFDSRQGLADCVATSPAWAKLPQLRELVVAGAAYDDDESTRQETEAIAAAVAAATALARLSLSLHDRDAWEDELQDDGSWEDEPPCLQWLAGVVAVLPVHSLHHLTLFAPSGARDGAALSAALVRLSSLQQLKVDCLPVICWPALGQLSHLTQLELTAAGCEDTAATAAAALQQLPLSLRQLRLNFARYGLPVDIRHLTRLEELVLTAGLADGTVFPLQLQHLSLPSHDGYRRSAAVLAFVMPLQQLTYLDFGVGFSEQAPLLRLAQLPALQRLCLVYDIEAWQGLANCLTTSPAWAKLPQLRELRVYGAPSNSIHGGNPTRQQTVAILADTVAATTLTKLSLWLARPRDIDAHEVADVCGRLAGLTGLKHLELDCSPGGGGSLCPFFVPCNDVLALTALTGLTWLCLRCPRNDLPHHPVGEAAAAALVDKLTRLHRLDLW